MKYLIGIDGGGTKTSFLLAEQTGKIINKIDLPTTHYLQCGFSEMAERLKEGITTIIGTINIKDILSIAICLAGYTDSADDDLLIEKAIQKELAGYPYKIYSDTINAHRGALLGKPGINIIAGTGSIAFGIDDNGKSNRCGGWNHLFGGDEGSAYWLGCKLILEFTRQSDGRDPRTELYTYVKNKFNLSDDGEIIVRTVEELGFKREEIALLAKDVSYLANKGDTYAIKIYDQAAEELFELTDGLVKRLHFNKPIWVSGTGGVFKSGDCLLKPLKNKLESINAKFVKAALPPDKGSVIVAALDKGMDISSFIIQ